MYQRVYFVLTFVVASIFLSTAQNDPFFTSDNKVDCVNKMVDWCDNMNYPKDGSGMAMISISVTDNSGKFWRVFCSSDSDGTNCTRNASPWFSCNPDRQLIYQGVQLKKDSTDDVDDGICNTTKMAFNDIFIQNLSFNPVNATKEITKGMENFFEMLAELQEQFDLLRGHIFNDCFPFCPRDSSGRVPDSGESSPTESPDVSATQSNQLERE